MTYEPGATRHIDRFIWSAIAAVAAADVLAASLTRFTILWPSFLVPAAASLGIWACSEFYFGYRRSPELGTALGCTAQICAFFAVGAPLSYLAASMNFPLQDSWFDAADRGLGLDWRALLDWMNAHPALHPVFSLAYLSFAPQAIVVTLILSYCGRLKQLRLVVLALMFAALITIAVSAVLPAEGVWGHLGLSAVDYPHIAPVTQELHLRTFFGLRHGSFRALMAQHAEGIITFPSLHAAYAFIFILALWPVRILRWFAIALNATMLIATPVEGGHYFIDVIAGIVVAVVCWRVALRVAEHAARRGAVAAGPIAKPGLVAGD